MFVALNVFSCRGIESQGLLFVRIQTILKLKRVDLTKIGEIPSTLPRMQTADR